MCLGGITLFSSGTSCGTYEIGSHWESGDAECCRSVQLVDGGVDGWDVGEKLESFFR